MYTFKGFGTNCPPWNVFIFEFSKMSKESLAHGGHNKCEVDECMEYRKIFAPPSNLSSFLSRPQWKICWFFRHHGKGPGWRQSLCKLTTSILLALWRLGKWALRGGVWFWACLWVSSRAGARESPLKLGTPSPTHAFPTSLPWTVLHLFPNL